ncbi:MAG: Rdx family protein [Deltaproteobacteria bacterium]|nr:Rdx family protein [Deltaproteobacteria bacterium]
MKVNYPGSKIKLIPGSGGIFDVTCDGRLIYSKADTKDQRFPEEGEVSRLIGKK